MAYIYRDPGAIGGLFSSGGFVGIEEKPQTVLGAFLYGKLVDCRPKTFTEPFKILCKDELAVTFEASVKMSLDPHKVRDAVEKYSAAGGEEGTKAWYERNTQQFFRNFVYDSVKDHKSRDAAKSRDDIRDIVLKRMKDSTKDTPFIVHDVVIGNIQYPEEVANAVVEKLIRQQELERKDTEVAIANLEAQKRIEEAKGIADAQNTIGETLTPNYLRYGWIMALDAAALNPETVIYVATGPDGLPMFSKLPDKVAAK